MLPLLDQGLGNQAYLVDLGDGRALALDPMIDLRSLDAGGMAAWAAEGGPVVTVELGAVGSAPLEDWPLVTMCGHGERAATAASVLERVGRAGLRTMPCGPEEWAQASGGSVEVGA